MPISKIDTAALAITDLAYTGTLTGGAGVVNLGSGQVYKDASGNIGIGLTNPHAVVGAKVGTFGANTNTAGCSFGVDSSGATQPIMGLRWTGANGGIAGSNFSAQLVSDSANALYTEIYTTGATPLVFGTNSTERVRIDSTGTLVLAQGQIQFPATQASSSNANTLDDYEEGTWTPSFIVTYGSSTWGSYLQQTGSYVKIGRLVYCMFNIGVPSLVNGGNIGLSGLPFQVDANAGATCGGAREGAQTGAWYQAESVNNNQIGVLRRYDNGGFPNGSVNMSGFVTYIASA